MKTKAIPTTYSCYFMLINNKKEQDVPRIRIVYCIHSSRGKTFLYQ